MLKSTVPNSSTALRISTPHPGLLYGYKSEKAFSDVACRHQFASIRTESSANNENLTYPFLVVEMKPGRKSDLDAATYQALGGVASCLQTLEGLQLRFEDFSSASQTAVDNIVFGIVTNGTETRLFVSWKDAQGFFMQRIGAFLLREPEQFHQLRQYLRNIVDWGRGKRLEQIRHGLSHLPKVGISRKRRQTSSQGSSNRPVNRRAY